MPPAHPTVIDEAMASDTIAEGAAPSGGAIDQDCANSLRIHEEPTLTQLVEEGIEDADKEDEVNEDLM